MQFKENENLLFIRLFPDENFFRSLEEICKSTAIETAVVVSGLGQLKNFELAYFKE